jgi:hypothetical protein
MTQHAMMLDGFLSPKNELEHEQWQIKLVKHRMLFLCPFSMLVVPLRTQLLSLFFGVRMVFTNVIQEE